MIEFKFFVNRLSKTINIARGSNKNGRGMLIPVVLLTIAIALALIHISVPASYYAYMVKKAGCELEGSCIDDDSYPTVTVIIPTYNEAKIIERKIRDVLRQDYPKDKMEVLVVDSGSDDGTAGIAEGLGVEVLRQEGRKGKGNALNYALSRSSGEVIIISDADSTWVGGDAIKKAVSLLKEYGGVTCIKEAYNKGIEKPYRDLYNNLRVGESCFYSTPIAHGEFFAFKRGLIEGFSEDIGADDSRASHEIAMRGNRFIATKSIVCKELVPEKGYLHWRIRRAQHLVQHFSKVLREIKEVRDPRYKRILQVESYLHLFNPWFLIVALSLDVASSCLNNITAIALLALFFISLLSAKARTWIITQFLLALSQVRNAFTKEIVWKKEAK